jgi:hypothetical protein
MLTTADSFIGVSEVPTAEQHGVFKLLENKEHPVITDNTKNTPQEQSFSPRPLQRGIFTTDTHGKQHQMTLFFYNREFRSALDTGMDILTNTTPPVRGAALRETLETCILCKLELNEQDDIDSLMAKLPENEDAGLANFKSRVYKKSRRHELATWWEMECKRIVSKVKIT